MVEKERATMTKAEGVALAGTGGSWTGAIAAFAAQALPVVQVLAAIGAIACSYLTARYIYKKTQLLGRERR
jgi:NAD(P)H-hydrate repair Nnr-like enzyme with NAD(P)H-hydrate dehydratase domain